MKSKQHLNRLSEESSLYLQQHATNPIDWFPWGKEAFTKAQKENKLMLISIGYSSCHWCHVMEREVFEKVEAAEFLNEHFVCVKVDREERPDIDNVYMLAVQLMTNQGGWPLNCFTLPDGKPIYGGTYFPLQKFLEIGNSLAELFQMDPKDAAEYAKQLEEGMRAVNLVKSEGSESFAKVKLNDLLEDWELSFDWKYGGMNRAPKFPLPNNYEFLFEYATRYENQKVLDFVNLTWQKILQGGIYDQIEGGMFRYSTDVYWKEPHFEKMLYDNAQFISLLSGLYLNEPNPEYKFALNQTLGWLENVMKTDEGFYKSSIDADSDGQEGAFYIWKITEVKDLFGDGFKKVADFYRLNESGWWKNDQYILQRGTTLQDFMTKNKIQKEDFDSWQMKVNEELRHRRMQRPAPVIDAKVIMSWNCMLAIGMLDAALTLDDSEIYKRAKNLAHRIEEKYVTDSKIYRIVNRGRSIEGFLDDYVYYIRMCINFHQYTLDFAWLEKAQTALKHLDKTFEKSGPLFYYSKDDELLVGNALEINDNVIPASNSLLANIFWDLGVILSDEKYLDQARKMLQIVYPKMESYGSGYSNWAILLCKVLAKDVLLTYQAVVAPSEHLGNLRKYKRKVLFSQETITDKEQFQICFDKRCLLPETNFSHILPRLSEILSE